MNEIRLITVADKMAGDLERGKASWEQVTAWLNSLSQHERESVSDVFADVSFRQQHNRHRKNVRNMMRA